MTWTIAPSPRLAEQPRVVAAIARFYEAFAQTMQSDRPLEEILPFCVWKMPYYQRIGANALSRSIRGAIDLGDQRAIAARDWLPRLPGLERLLLTGPD